MRLKKRESIIMLVVLLVLIIAIIGVSYAAFNYSRTGEKLNSITTGSVTMSYEESDNVINLTGSLPTVDEAGKKRLKQGEYFDFTISSNIVGNININYEISAKDVTTSDRKIDGSNIKLYLTRLTDDGEEELMTPEVYNEETSENTYTGRPSGEMSLYTSSMNSSESNNYRLRMWVDEGYNPQGDGGNLQFSVQINVYGKSGDKMPNKTGPVSDVVLDQDNLGENASTYDDGVDTFITGEDPNNYVWYSGKLWRVVSVNNKAKTTKLVTQWDISEINYNGNGNSTFKGSYMEAWLNDESVDGFLYNLRDYENFIMTDSIWNASQIPDTSTRPQETIMVTDPVGLLNIYEYQFVGGLDSYLNNGLWWWTITPSSSSIVYYIDYNGNIEFTSNANRNPHGVRPSINLKANINIVDGSGTATDPYRLEGDNDENLNGTLLNTRYSGEYIRFGTGENNLYRIVSHETEGLTKIASSQPLKNNSSYLTMVFGNNNRFSNTNTVGSFLNNNYLNPTNNYLTNEQVEMIEDNTTWYLGNVPLYGNYKLAKYINATDITLTSSITTAKVGLLRFGELMSGQFDRNENNSYYWLLTPGSSYIHSVSSYGDAPYYPYSSKKYGVQPALNLKQNVIITSGDGTKEEPFTIALT